MVDLSRGIFDMYLYIHYILWPFLFTCTYFHPGRSVGFKVKGVSRKQEQQVINVKERCGEKSGRFLVGV